MGQEQEVDLPTLFNDVSKTISGISNIMGGAGTSSQGESLDGSGGPSVMSGLFGNSCFKACGMEDIQFAARSAGDMLITLRLCVLVFTIVSIICLLCLTGSVLFLVCRKNHPNRFPLPAFVRDVFPAKNNAKASDSS